MSAKRCVIFILLATPIITGLTVKDKIPDVQHLKRIRQQSGSQAPYLQGSIHYNQDTTTTKPKLPTTNVPCNDTDGTVVITLAEKCMQMVCRRNVLVPQYAYGDETCTCCEFNGRLYKQGEQLAGVCMKMFCCDGHWQTTEEIDDCCSHCDVYGYPNIKTFDARTTVPNFYNIHSTCNHSLAQQLDMYMGRYDAKFGVYAKFATWDDYSSTSVNVITFKDNKHTVLEIDLSDFSMRVNGMDIPSLSYLPSPLVDQNGNTHPVLAWLKHKNDPNSPKSHCIGVIGSQGIMIFVCARHARIYAHSSLHKDIGGICGFFNGNDQDDFMTRKGLIEPQTYNPVAVSLKFINSWTTTPRCEAQYGKNRCPDEKPEIAMKNYDMCEKIVINAFNDGLSEDMLNNLIASCVHDLCSSAENFMEEIMQYYEDLTGHVTFLEIASSGLSMPPPCNHTTAKPTVTETKILTTTIFGRPNATYADEFRKESKPSALPLKIKPSAAFLPSHKTRSPNNN